MKNIAKKVLVSVYRYSYKYLHGTGIGNFKIGKFKIMQSLHVLFLRKVQYDYAVIDGHKIFVNKKRDMSGITIQENFSEDEIKIVNKYARKGDTVVDIGANIGFFTLMLAKAVGREGKVYAFEPDPENFKLLTKNIKENGYKNVTLINKAISNKSEKIKLYLCKDSCGDNKTYKTKESRKEIDIECISLNEYFKEKEKINFIKIDIQGFEVKAMKGASEILDKNKNIIIFSEFWSSALKDAGTSAEDYLKLFKDKNFRLFRADVIKNTLVDSSNKELLERYNDTDDFTDIIFKRDNKSKKGDKILL